MKEKDITTKVLKALRNDDRFGSGLYELKMARGKTLPAGALAEHQYHALGAACEKMYFKIPDVGYQNPADAFILKGAEGWLVIWFQLGVREHEVWALPYSKIPMGKSIGISYAIENGIEIDV